jgi:hypothetical protein
MNNHISLAPTGMLDKSMGYLGAKVKLLKMIFLFQELIYLFLLI